MNALVEALAAVWALKWVIAFTTVVTAGALWADSRPTSPVETTTVVSLVDGTLVTVPHPRGES